MCGIFPDSLGTVLTPIGLMCTGILSQIKSRVTLTIYFLPFTTDKFNKLINKHVPMKTISNRKAKQFSKPWITKGIRISIKVKNKLYASGDTTNYKIYRNKICTLTRLSKQQYYSKFFNDNLTNMKKFGRE